jgi:outer membrane protein OmpA-like peptidoglycan-associated protein/uncharacterized protein YidB (DUF937 family)
MTMIDTLTNEMGSRFGIGARAQPLMRELLQVMTGGPGGLGGFLDRFRNAGMGNEVASFLGGRNETALPPKTVDAVLGDATVAGISRRVGLAPSVVSSAAGFEIPKLIGMLTPGGRLPTSLPSEVESFVKSDTPDQAAPIGMAVVGDPEQQARPSAQAPPIGMATVREAPRRNFWPWIIGLLVLAALLGWLLSRRPHTAAPPQTAAVAPAPATHAPAPAATPTPVPATPAPAPAPATSAQAAAPAARTANELNDSLSRTVLNFRTGSAVLPPAADPALQQAAERIRALPSGTVIEISGHTDNTGDANANMALSQRRAEAVRNALVQHGVNPAMLTARGYGDTQPVASNDTASGRSQNRRIAFNVAGQAATNSGQAQQQEAPAANGGGG